MKNLPYTVIILLIVQVAIAQNYYPVNRKDIYYFSDSSNSAVFSLKIDSVKAVGQDSVYYMFKQIRPRKSPLPNLSCNYNGQGDSWLGNTIRVKPDGSCILLNRNRDEFLIKTKANVNDSWIAYQNS
ncbi:MAG: hypothetical protein K2Q22_16525, partial [Cytophagales bacterium]|nr:hypothetical protein [Cytophagales bacterium]